ncbi:glycoside hydrolase [Setomelanomma holmii]|uniref:Glycoside hydrolase n=1 Tax=Setomelanomma holmii TaxID=210430 RepID=A0A9P4LFP5_9PLEO|nr:glycoside hydrolase [Setomelanomma holmii]
MKSIVLASGLVTGLLVGAASGRPLLKKRALVTEVIYVTETVADVVVYVDVDGVPYTTSTPGEVASTPSAVVSTTSSIAAPTTEPAPALPVPSSSSAPAPLPAPLSALPSFGLATSVEINRVSTTSEAPQTTQTPPPAPSSESPSAPPPAPSSSTAPDVPVQKTDNSGGLGMGVTYDPFAGTGEDSRCKTDQEIADDFDRMKDFKAVRIYGMDCNQIPLAVQNAQRLNQKLMAGAYLSNQGNGEDLGQVIQTWKNAIDQYSGGRWDIVSLFSVENERVNDHDMTVSDVVNAINRARGQLRGLGYTGPVGAVETVPATIDNPAICDASDIAMINCHAFFDSNTVAQDAGKFVKSQVQLVANACNNKRVVVTESGWPHQGDPNGKAVPSPENQRIALQSIRNNFDHDMFFHNAFDSTWKTDWASSFNAERYWGIM